jgi:transforming growth factor-beta-induced protein
MTVTSLTFAACASSSNEADTTAVTVGAEPTAAEPTAAEPTPTEPAATDTTVPAPSDDDVFTTIESSGQYPTFSRLVEQAGLAETLRTGGPFTIAVPTEEAFEALPKETLDALQDDVEELARLLKYHIVPALVEPGKSVSIETLEGSTIDVQFTETTATINTSKILNSPRATANGAFVKIDRVLVPPAA